MTRTRVVRNDGSVQLAMALELDLSKLDNAELVCFQSNQFTLALYHMTAMEKKILYILIATLKPKQASFQIMKFQTSDLMRYLGQDGNNYHAIREAIRRLQRRLIYIKEEKSTLEIQFVGHARYYERQGYFECSFHPQLEPYLLLLKENFTAYPVEVIMKLNSFYSQRLYELVCSYKSLGMFSMTVDRLKEIFCITDRYTKYNDFKRNVIIPAYEELKEKADFYFEYDEEKEGKRVEKLQFTVIKHDQAAADPANEKVKRMKEILEKEFQISRPKIAQILKELSITDVFATINIVRTAIKSPKITIGTVSGYAVSIFENRYPQLKKSPQEESFPVELLPSVAKLEKLTAEQYLKKHKLKIVKDKVMSES